MRAGIARGERRLKYKPDDEQARREVAALRSELAATKLAEYIRKIVDSAPPLTDEQRSRLAVMFQPREAA